MKHSRIVAKKMRKTPLPLRGGMGASSSSSSASASSTTTSTGAGVSSSAGQLKKHGAGAGSTSSGQLKKQGAGAGAGAGSSSSSTTSSGQLKKQGAGIASSSSSSTTISATAFSSSTTSSTSTTTTGSSSSSSSSTLDHQRLEGLEGDREEDVGELVDDARAGGLAGLRVDHGKVPDGLVPAASLVLRVDPRGDALALRPAHVPRQGDELALASQILRAERDVLVEVEQQGPVQLGLLQVQELALVPVECLVGRGEDGVRPVSVEALPELAVLRGGLGDHLAEGPGVRGSADDLANRSAALFRSSSARAERGCRDDGVPFERQARRRREKRQDQGNSKKDLLLSPHADDVLDDVFSFRLFRCFFYSATARVEENTG
eukprot:CAMPEP_0197196576 /NCGR_PEP_ID=MMETSP1423-20130617/32429_1 /TAXON_ID=476441 /ORGANISM="Pseudo-nitzschia heimii, Strain UNC1101" /LENGTH=375 /DNA_ID=CAMNT_0042650383 /DNA_START=541 /DNA_END=1667 /DNA_ORIENTATION=+